jgi:hypothetical protein
MVLSEAPSQQEYGGTMKQEAVVAFKRGSDLESLRAAPGNCRRSGPGESLKPPLSSVRPDVSEAPPPERAADMESEFTIERTRRHFSVFENGRLLCMTVYRKGAQAVVLRLTADRR